MTAPARLLSVRLQGFKSFAERTLVTFGPGISAVVGPNGSGKSNLADALRWSLGEQGRALRSRKAEDVIWAGSERRSAVGMADVQLTLDNADALLPVEYGTVELGRRLYRSGENEYLLNRQRVRLRDLVDFLDAAHLAENAFLFIGQGMVDQALALRPEERRPLFEEVAGVHRHERRRRRAEEQLVESEANLARVEDIVSELRPQVRRLAAQAEQQATRLSAGDELVLGLLAAGHARWHEAGGRISSAERILAAARADVDTALVELSRVEAASTAAAQALDERARSGAALRARADAARTVLTAARLEEGRITAERSALGRDRERISGERAATDADLAQQRRRLAAPTGSRDVALDAALADAERELAAALAELADLQAANQARDEDSAAVRRAGTARAAEVEAGSRRLAEAERRLAEETANAASMAEKVDQATRTTAHATTTLEVAVAAEGAAASAREEAARAWTAAGAAAATAAERAGTATAGLAAAHARVDAAKAAIEDDRSSGFAARMRDRGARRVDDGLVVDPVFQAAADTALAGAARAYLTTTDGLLEKPGDRGLGVVADRLRDVSGMTVAPPSAGQRPAGTAPAGRAVAGLAPDPGVALRDHVAAAGGGLLREAIRRDGAGAASRLLARVVWLPDLASALGTQPILPAGWSAVPLDGSALIGEVTVRLGGSDRTLERKAELDRSTTELRAAEKVAGLAAADRVAAENAMAAARNALDAARSAEDAATGERRRAEEEERLSARRLEADVREAAWHAAQMDRLAAEVERARAAVPAPLTPSVASAGDPAASDALRTWQARAAELRSRRDRLAAQVAETDAIRREADRRRAAAEAAIDLDEARLAATDRSMLALAERERAMDAERDALVARLAEAVVREAEAGEALHGLEAADAADRSRLGEAEHASAAARDRLRAAEDAARVAEVRDLEARLGLDAIREQLQVELAGLGSLSLRHLEPAGDPAPADDQGRVPTSGSSGPTATDEAAVPAAATSDAAAADAEAADDEGEDAARLTAALAAAGTVWAATAPPDPPPSPGRLAGLRRRYHELGAANPFAVDEYATVRTRLEQLEGQRDDLRTAIDRTRSLIAELDTMISTQFRSTFAALETRFDARFRQLFGGGFARLSLTDPEDLASTGIEIVARPPGKKPQALAMLSGGERALTAVALLFAMLEVRPVPFCVLDEVDAALDEANVGRFTAALRELAEATQFIVITHNRGTIEIADALYGVTVGDDSVSRVISLRLDEATELAEQGRSDGAVGPAVAAGSSGMGSPA